MCNKHSPRTTTYQLINKQSKSKAYTYHRVIKE